MYKPIIGLEIHVELKTISKMFCQCSADYFGKKPNTHLCPVCLGLPGTLPVPNKKAIDWAVRIGHALNCRINSISKFDRKHYFYPDLPKGYQISQYDEPIASNGWLQLKMRSEKLEVENKRFGITRVHLEEDTAKLIHRGDDTLIDFNRSGVPLVEIVTEPDFDNADDVKQFLEELQVIIRYLDVSDANMEKGTMRLEPNISLAVIPGPPTGGSRNLSTKKGIPPPPPRAGSRDDTILPNYKVEVKNINSFRFVKQAVEYELKRQEKILEKGETPVQETRGYDEKKGATYSQRMKEEAKDYRYFPEPDIPPLQFTDKHIADIKKQLPELPSEKMKRYVSEYGLKEQDAFILTRNKKITEFFEQLSEKLKATAKFDLIKNVNQSIANFIINRKISTELPIEKSIDDVVKLLTPKETDTKLLEEVVIKVIAQNQKVVQDFNSGKQNAIMFLVGQVMREMKGKAEALKVKDRLIKKITS